MDRLGLQIQSGGILGKGATQSFRDQVKGLRMMEARSGYNSVSNFRGYAESLLTLDSPQAAKKKISNQRLEQIRKQRTALAQTAIQMRDEIISQGYNTREKFAGYGNGLGGEILRLGGELGVDFTEAFVKTIKTRRGELTQAEIDEDKKAVKERTDAYIKASNAAFSAKQNMFAQMGNVDSARLGLAQTYQMFNRGTVKANASNQLIQGQAAQIAGSSNVDVLANMLSQYRRGSQMGGPRGQAATIAMNTTTTALQRLADASGRTATQMEALNRIQQAKLSREQLVEQYITSDAQGKADIRKQYQAGLMAEQRGTLQGITDPQKLRDIMSGLAMRGEAGQLAKSKLLATADPRGLGRINQQEKQLQDKVLTTQHDALRAQQALAGHMQSQTKYLDANTNQMRELSGALKALQVSIPEKIEHVGKYDVTVHGLESMNQIKNSIEGLIVNVVDQQLNKYINLNTGEPRANRPMVSRSFQ